MNLAIIVDSHDSITIRTIQPDGKQKAETARIRSGCFFTEPGLNHDRTALDPFSLNPLLI